MQARGTGPGVGVVHFGSTGERARIRPVAVAPATPYLEHMSEMPISEASGHLDEVADERALPQVR
jgi:hypothetical protein